MQIEVNMRHIPRAGESTRSRHEIAIRSLRAADGSTKRNASDLLCVLEFADDDDEMSTAGSDLGPICAEGVSAVAYYGRRYPGLADMAMDDDSLILKLDPDKADYCRFVNESLAIVIGHFSPYRADIHLDLDLATSDFERANRLCIEGRVDVDARRVVQRINPVNYFDRELCRRAFNTTPEEIVKVLTGNVERVEMLNDGVFLVVTSELIDRPKIEAIDPAIRPLFNRSTSRKE